MTCIPWTRPEVGENILERHVLKSARVSSPQAPQVTNMVTDAFAQGPEAPGRRTSRVRHDSTHLASVVSRMESDLTCCGDAQALQNIVVSPGTTFAMYAAEPRILVANARCLGPFAPGNGTMQMATKTSIGDQYSTLGEHIFAGM